jgi:hypothetical protein
MPRLSFADVNRSDPTSLGSKLILGFSTPRRLTSGLYTLAVIHRLDGRRVVAASAVRVRTGREIQ